MAGIMNNIALAQFAYSWPWYIVRASGLVAAALIILLILSGIGLITGHTFRLFEPLRAWAIHRAIGISLVVAIFSHIFFLLFDNYQRYSLEMILIPSISSLWVGFGIFAFYFLVVIIISSLLIVNSHKKVWKTIHLLSYLTVGLIFFHALNMGTDLKTGLLRYLWLGIGVVILIASMVRYWRSWAIKRG